MASIKASRREILAGSAILGLFATGRGLAMPRDQRTRPNIVFIMADDLGYADLSCYGQPDFETPNLDRLASQGIRLTSAYANSPVCSATRLALITGRYQYRLPAGLEEPLGLTDVGLPVEHPTLPSLLRANGYATALIGKWHLGSLPRFGPMKSGYEHFWGIRGGGVDYYTHKVGNTPDLWDGMQQVEEVGYLTDLLGEKAVSTISDLSQKNRPFFLSLHFTAPHWPWESADSEGEAESRRLAESKQPFATFHLDGGSRKTYANMVTRLDFQVGNVLKALERAGVAENTIVIFTSDNGGERFSNVWPFSGRKTELLEGGLRVPAIVRWPGHISGGSMSDQVNMSMDWMPTLLEAAGVSADPHYPVDGISFLDVLLGRAEPSSRAVFWRYLNMQQQACRIGDWKYLKINENTFLFNVVTDPLERANFKDREPEIYADLVKAWKAWDATMLPLDPAAFTAGFGPSELADHFHSDRAHKYP